MGHLFQQERSSGSGGVGDGVTFDKVGVGVRVGLEVTTTVGLGGWVGCSSEQVATYCQVSFGVGIGTFVVGVGVGVSFGVGDGGAVGAGLLHGSSLSHRPTRSQL
jgi:hypothetical protein